MCSGRIVNRTLFGASQRSPSQLRQAVDSLPLARHHAAAYPGASGSTRPKASIRVAPAVTFADPLEPLDWRRSVLRELADAEPRTYEIATSGDGSYSFTRCGLVRLELAGERLRSAPRNPRQIARFQAPQDSPSGARARACPGSAA